MRNILRKKKDARPKPEFHQGVTPCAICNQAIWEPSAGLTTDQRIVHPRCLALEWIGFTEGELERGWFYDPEDGYKAIRLEKWFQEQWDKKFGEGLRCVFGPLMST